MSGPTVNSLLEVCVGDTGEALASRVEDVDDESLLLAAPLGPSGVLVRPGSGTRITMLWIGTTSPMEMSATIVETRTQPLPVWVVQAKGEPQRSQRRAFFRLSIELPLSLWIGEDTVAADMLDLSEGGLRCRVSTRKAPRLGTAVGVTLVVGDDMVMAEAEVARSMPTSSTSQRELGLQFTALNRGQADLIRRHLMSEQLQRRAQGIL